MFKTEYTVIFNLNTFRQQSFSGEKTTPLSKKYFDIMFSTVLL